MFLWRFTRTDQMVEHNFTDKAPLIIGLKLYTVKIKLSSHLLIINDVVSHEMINGWCKIVDKYNRANYVKENLIEHLSCEYMPPFI